VQIRKKLPHNIDKTDTFYKKALELHFTVQGITIYGMKLRFLRYICLILIILSNYSVLGAFELEITAGVDGMTFHPDKKRPLSDSNEIFEPYPYGLANFNFKQDVTESIFFSINIERDKILQNSLDLRVASRTDRFKFEFGPFIGMTDDFEIPDIGVIGELELTFPGIFFISISGSSTLGAQIDFLSSNSRQTAGAKAGFWLGSLIMSVSANYKNLSRQKEEYLFVVDTLTRFGGSMDFYAKNSRTTGSFYGGYQIYSAEFIRGTLETSDKLNSWYAGAQLQWQVTQPLELKIGFEIPFKHAPVSSFTITEEFMLLSKIYAGFIYTFDDTGSGK